MSTRELRYTFIGDGSSDQALMPILNWLLSEYGVAHFQGQWAAHPPSGGGLKSKVEYALRAYPCDILFVHRDAERQGYEARLQEIAEATHEITVTWVPVIPVRMTEAWLLTSETAIRSASGNPNGKIELTLPSPKQIEGLSDPKQRLFDLLKTASKQKGRDLAKRNVFQARALVAEHTDDFSALRSLSAFQRLEAALKDALSRIGRSN